MNVTISLKNQLIMIVFGLFMIHNFFGFVRETIPADILAAEDITSIDQKTSAGNLPNGFAQYKWGDPAAKISGLQTVNKLSDDRVVYQVKNPTVIRPVNLIGTARPAKIYVMFAKNKLSYAIIQLPESNYSNTLSFMTKKFGKPEKTENDKEITLKWEDDKTVLFLKQPKNKFFFVQAIEKSYYKKY